MKYFLIRLEETNGEQSYLQDSVTEAKDFDDASRMALKSAKHWYEDYAKEPCPIQSSHNGDDSIVGYEHLGGSITVEVYEVRGIPKADYNVLKKYM